MKHLENLQDILSNYDAVFCDVWGVVHNGVHAFPDAVHALQQARRQGKTVILLTNSPRRADGVIGQLGGFDIHSDSYDGVVTSGDVTRDLIREAPKKIFFIGPDRDYALFDGLNVELVEEIEAQAVVVTGLFDDDHETPEDYKDILQRLRARNLPLICANPDLMVERGNKMLWCAGALARDYALLGGRTLVAGKPHRPIYELAERRLMELSGKDIARKRILGIGDGVLTDVKGADQYGLDVLFIAGGIHAQDYTQNGVVERAALDGFLNHHGFRPVAYMEALK